jgi:hypothetical protein
MVFILLESELPKLNGGPFRPEEEENRQIPAKVRTPVVESKY